MMTRTQAVEMAAAFKATGLFTTVEVEYFGFLSVLTPEAEAAANWHVNLWSVNARAGNRNLHRVRDYRPDPKWIKVAAKVAAKKATARDQAAYDRMTAERAANAE